MSPEAIFFAGIAISMVAVAGTIAAIIYLRIAKARLNKQLDTEYGQRRA